MQLSADSQLYIEIDRRVSRETQDFVYQVQWPATAPTGLVPFRIPRSERRSTTFVRTIHQYASGDVGTALFNLGASFPTMAARKCTGISTFQSVTGTLDSVIQYWKTPGSPEKMGLAKYKAAARHVSSRLRQIDFEGLARARARTQIAEVFHLASYSPTVE
jgi:hypothetical protein